MDSACDTVKGMVPDHICIVPVGLTQDQGNDVKGKHCQVCECQVGDCQVHA